tara:strand:+ start:421 stop:1395 length:975 start_codon:yes stop_codon:yes gene_type:complete
MLGLGSSLVGGAALGKQSEFSVLFDGDDQYIKTGGDSSTKPTTALTVSAWVNVDTADGGYGWPNPDGDNDHNQTIVGCIASGGYALGIQYGGTANNPITYVYANANIDNNGSGSAKYFSDAFYNRSDNGYEANSTDADLNATSDATADGPAVGAKGCTWGGYTSTTAGYTLHNIRNLTGWNHLAMTYSAGVMKLYINGSLKRTADSEDSSSNNINYHSNSAMEVMIGADVGSVPSGGADFVDGLIDDVAIWNAAIDADGITKIYNNGPLGTVLTAADGDYDNQSNLQAWWKLNEGTGTSAADSSSNSNTATLVNTPTWSTNTAG